MTNFFVVDRRYSKVRGPVCWPNNVAPVSKCFECLQTTYLMSSSKTSLSKVLQGSRCSPQQRDPQVVFELCQAGSRPNNVTPKWCLNFAGVTLLGQQRGPSILAPSSICPLSAQLKTTRCPFSAQPQLKRFRL